jgi:hypothetical protein
LISFASATTSVAVEVIASISGAERVGRVEENSAADRIEPTAVVSFPGGPVRPLVRS